MPHLASNAVAKRNDPRDRIEPISMRIPEACRFTGISRSTLYVLISRGEIEIIKLGNSTLVLTESLRQLVEGRRGRNGRVGHGGEAIWSASRV
jgi:excisionase family DNA binding protein